MYRLTRGFRRYTGNIPGKFMSAANRMRVQPRWYSYISTPLSYGSTNLGRTTTQHGVLYCAVSAVLATAIVGTANILLVEPCYTCKEFKIKNQRAAKM